MAIGLVIENDHRHLSGIYDMGSKKTLNLFILVTPHDPILCQKQQYLEFVEVFFKLVGSHGPFVGTVLHKGFEKGRLLKANPFVYFFQHQAQLQSFFELKRKRKQ